MTSPIALSTTATATCSSTTDCASPEAAVDYAYFGVNLAQATWSYPATNRLLFQAGATFLHNVTARPSPARSQADRHRLHRAVEELQLQRRRQSGSTPAGHGERAGLRPAATSGSPCPTSPARTRSRLGWSLLQGRHNLGIVDVNQKLYYKFLTPACLAPVPNSIVQWAGPNHTENKIKLDLGLYAQDQWTLKRLTLNLGLRFDYFNALRAGAAPARRAVRPGVRLRQDRQRAELQGPRAAPGRRVRSVRQRQDRGEGDVRAIRGQVWARDYP